MALSRRDFLASSAAAVAIGAAGRRALAWQQQPAPITPVFTPIRRNIGFFTGRGGTIGYLTDPKAIVTVDSQFPDSAKLFIDGLAAQTSNRPIDLLINTHHHGDHTAGNSAFKGVAKNILAHERAVVLQKETYDRAVEAAKSNPNATPPAVPVYADKTMGAVWREQFGDEWVRTTYYGPAHTGGDVAITFERANVAHLGDLMFNRREPVLDRPGGTNVANWIKMLAKVPGDHSADTIFIFGHAGAKFPLTGNRADVEVLRNYLTTLMEFVRAQRTAGKTKEEVAAMTGPLKGFEEHGNLTARTLNAVFDELAG